MSQPLNYRDVRAFSQSSLKLLDFSVTKFHREEYLWVIGQKLDRPDDGGSDAMTLGSLVDAILTRPDDVKKEYEVINCNVGGQMKDFVEEFFKIEQSMVLPEDSMLDPEQAAQVNAKVAYDLVGFKRDKLETVIARFRSEGLEYYNALRKTIGKKIVSTEVIEHANSLVKCMEEDEFIGPIIRREKGSGISGGGMQTVDVYDQLAIYWEERGLKLKALLDKVVVNHMSKTVQPYDIKTTGSSNFQDAYGMYRYDLQGAFYTDALRHWMKEQGIEDYTILPFKFIVAFTNEKGIGPQMWQMGARDYTVGRWGVTRPKEKKVKGYSTLIDDLLWHIKEDKWKYPKEVYMNKGVRELNYYVDDFSKH